MKYLGAVKEKNSIGLVVTSKGIKLVPFIKVELGDHLWQDGDGKVTIGEEQKEAKNKDEKSEELASLRERCDELGIKYAHNTGAEKLKKMIEVAEAELSKQASNDSNDSNDSNEGNENNEGANQ